MPTTRAPEIRNASRGGDRPVSASARPAVSRVSLLLAAAVAAGVLGLAGCASVSQRLAPKGVVMAPSGVDRIPAAAGASGREILVEGWIDGRGPFLFQFDTGAAVNVLDEGVADALGLPDVGVSRERFMVDGETRESTHRLREARRLRLGETTFEGVLFRVEKKGEPGSDRWHLRDPVVGLIGFTTFRDLMLTVDVPGRELVVRPPAAGRHLFDDFAGNVLPMRTRDGVPVIEVAFEPRDAGATTVMDFVIDTGCSDGFLMPGGLRGETFPGAVLPVARGTGVTFYGTGEVTLWLVDSTLVLGRERLERFPPPAFYESGTMLSERFGLLGMGVLRDYRMTFDTAGGRVLFERVRDTRDRDAPFRIEQPDGSVTWSLPASAFFRSGGPP